MASASFTLCCLGTGRIPATEGVIAAPQRLDEVTALAPDAPEPPPQRGSDESGALIFGSQDLDRPLLVELEGDPPSVDALVALGKSYQQQYEITPPRDLISKVQRHLRRLRQVPIPRGRAARNNLAVAIGEGMVLAARLHTRLRNYGAADEQLKFAQGAAVQTDNAELLALTLRARAILHTNIDSGRPYGRRLTNGNRDARRG